MSDQNQGPSEQGGDFSVRAREGWTLGRRLRSRDSYGVLLLLILALLVATAVAGRTTVARGLVVVLTGTLLLYALWTSRAERRIIRLALVVVPLCVAVLVALAGDRSDAARAAVAGAEAALALGAIVAIIRQVVAHPRISVETIMAALCTYLLLGLLFASVYTTVDAAQTTPFFTSGPTRDPVDFLYFSYVTIATVGYGDFTAAGDLGRMLAVTEALIGQLYLVTVVALVIGNVGRERPRRS